MHSSELYPIYLQLPAANIVLLKFLLESYEGIAELRTLNSDQALVMLLALPDTVQAVEKLLDSEKHQLNWSIPVDPPNMDNDWLLSSIKNGELASD